jgi:hypothetical protein
LWCSQSDNYVQEDLAKFGYKLNMTRELRLHNCTKLWKQILNLFFLKRTCKKTYPVFKIVRILKNPCLLHWKYLENGRVRSNFIFFKLGQKFCEIQQEISQISQIYTFKRNNNSKAFSISLLKNDKTSSRA